MEKNLIQGAISKLRALGIYQIAGGVIGLGLTIWIIVGLTITSALLFLLLLIPLALYAYSIYCGILLLKKNISGLRHSLINQILQLVSFSIFGFIFQYISGVYLSVGLDLTSSFNLTFNVGISSWQITINGSADVLILNFNFVAFFLVIFIERLKKKIKEEQVENQIRSIGQ